MAGVEAISFGTISTESISSVKSSASVSVDTNQFENFLQNSDDSKLGYAKDISKEENKSVSAYERESGSAKQDVTRMSEESETEQTYDMEKITETADALKNGIKDIVKENLGVDEEQINSVLETMGITIVDLLNPQILQQFVLQLHGGQENMDFLMNETLMSDYSNLLQDLQSFLTDDMKALLMMMESMENPMTLDEFMIQAGIAKEMTDVSQNVVVDTEVSEQTSMMSQSENASVAQIATQDENVDMSLVEKITIQTSEEAATQENVLVSKDLTQNNSNGNDLMNSMMSENSSEQLFANASDAEGVATSLFAEQFDTVQNDISRLFTNQVSGNQRMQQMVDIVNQVSNSIRNSLNANTTTMEVQLNPESLGKVLLSVVSKDGVMTATFQVQTDEAKNALESQIYTLKENLEARNLKVESVDVQISDFNFSQSDSAKGQNQSEATDKGKKHFKFDSEISGETEISEEESAEQVRKQVMRDMGGSIDFTA